MAKKWERIFLLDELKNLLKGGHLAGNLDSEYKKDFTKLYDSEVQEDWSHQKLSLKIENPKKVRFQFVSESELSNALNEIFGE